MFQDQAGKTCNTYEERISFLDTHRNRNEMENIEEEISVNFDDYLENCGHKLGKLPSNMLCNIFDLRSKLLKNQKEKKKKVIQTFIISILIIFVSLLYFYYFNGMQNILQFIGSLSKYKYKNKEKIYLENVLLGAYYDGEGASKIKIYVYQNQTKYQITHWNGNVSYSKPEVLKTWTNIQRSHITSETKYTSENLGDCVVLKRDIITDPDGNVSYSGWTFIKTCF